MNIDKEKARAALNECVNADTASPDALAFVESLKVDGKIDVGLAVYALAFYSGLEASERCKNESHDSSNPDHKVIETHAEIVPDIRSQ